MDSIAAPATLVVEPTLRLAPGSMVERSVRPMACGGRQMLPVAMDNGKKKEIQITAAG
ncbi:hypothetical protein [Xanthomonas hortorum]|uniref:Uncharacterized protein n=1 Tax=Xanthomonas hortorum pv. hederae TaxID=453603 RepID=A0A9X4BVA1_9XANT|nr:hypothetical protein [Xanthomonas hortorum]MCE4369707.1 hypothetical protein [Xanthomonas hortorum pv. hederae]MDC8640220.1 hypothetical protein [Xanthomonas hortorum pv. hederae]